MDQELLAQLYKDMRRIRRFEETALDFCRGGRGQVLSYRNKEAVAVGVTSVIDPDDFVISSCYCHGIFLARGGAMRELFAEQLGRSGGCSGGAAGLLNVFDIEHRYIGGWSLTGMQASIAAGFAYAQVHHNVPNVTICFITDRDIRNGILYEVAELADEWSLPLVFVYEHSHTDLASYKERKTCNFSLLSQESIDGHDLFAVRGAIFSAITKARETHSSTFVEAHVVSGTLRDELVLELDPLVIMSKKLDAFKMSSIRERIDTEIETELQQALRFADTSLPAQATNEGLGDLA